MNNTLDEALCRRYPKIFQNRHQPMTTTAMCWGFDHGDGWYNIIDMGCSAIQNHIDSVNRHIEYLTKNNPFNQSIPEPVQQVVADQVKEKFGTLRFYYHGGDSYIDGVVAMMEYMSAKTCEVCGHPGSVRDGGWVRTLCDKHHQRNHE